MTASTNRSVVADVLAALQIQPSRPRFTGYTDGGRTELSGTVLLNWAAKVAGLLVDELGGGPGDTVLVSTPAHWQTAGLLLGAWQAGLTVTDDPAVPAFAAFVPPGSDADADDVFVVSGHPLGLDAGGLAAHQRGFSTVVLPQADRFLPRAAAATAVLTSSGDLSAAALASAVRGPSGMITGQRVLTAGAWTLAGQLPGVVELLLRPLVAGAAVIHTLDLDPGGDEEQWLHRAEVERADVTIGVDVPGLPRLG